ncbi:hypothetical protein [Bradyrhizobium sp. RDI18]|uniref:hypothetical protein n=1 Tax=Bradyrhizobium sp. RDI18 TaxID=3367400 RepID=UPI003719D484
MILISETDAEAALTVTEHDIGWVVEPGNTNELVKIVSGAAKSVDPQRAERATEVSKRFDFAAAMVSYCDLIRELVQKKPS